MIDLIFPPLPTNADSLNKMKSDSSPMAQLRYSSFSYWRDPLPEIGQPVDNSGNLNRPSAGANKDEEVAKK